MDNLFVFNGTYKTSIVLNKKRPWLSFLRQIVAEADS
jgi:hypothetical protein